MAGVNLAGLDWPQAFAHIKGQVRRNGPVEDWHVVEEPCELVITFRSGSGSKELNVRCRCMVGTKHHPGTRFYGYDVIAVVPAGPEGLRRARKAWDLHVAEKSGS
jgi:hypothetical protein